MRVLLLNQFGAGSDAPTGRLAGELAKFLTGLGHDARVVSSDASYRVKRTGWRRWAHELRSHLTLFFRALALGRAEAVISLTSPVCLPVTARGAALLLGAKLYLWNMDLYPDLALTLRELKPGLLASTLRGLMSWAYASAAGVVALDGDMRDYLKTEYGVEAEIIPPWAPDLSWPAPPEPGPERTWLYSGNLGQAHEIKTLLEIQQRLEASGSGVQLVLQGGGAQWALSQEIARQLELRQVVWRHPVSEAELTASLLAADVLVVTRKPEMKGLLWPSKLALAQLSGRPVLWIGDTDSCTARALRSEPRNGTFLPGQKEEIFHWLNETLGGGSLPLASPTATEPGRSEGMRKWAEVLGLNRNDTVKTDQGSDQAP